MFSTKGVVAPQGVRCRIAVISGFPARLVRIFKSQKDFNQTFIAGALCDKGLFSSFLSPRAPEYHINKIRRYEHGLYRLHRSWRCAASGHRAVVCGYLKAPPDTAYIISGFRKRRILIGKAGWRIPFFERVDRISLRVMQGGRQDLRGRAYQ